MKISREIKTAILVISGILLLIFLYNYLKGQNLLDSSRTYYAVYNDVEGLAPSTPVTINGLTVGKVQSIGFKKDGSGQLLVKLMIENDFKFSKNSKAQLYEPGLIGGKAIAIIPAYDNAENAKNGAYLESYTKAGLSELVNKRLTPLQEKIEKMMVSADSLIGNINSIFDQPTRDHLQNSIAELNQTMTSFKETSVSLNQIVEGNGEKLNRTLNNFEQTSENLSAVTDSIAGANLAKTIRQFQATITDLETVVAGVENGNGSIGKLLRDEELYNNLEGASKQLEQLLQDFKLNPKRYVHFSVFGKKPKRFDAEGNEIEDEQN